MSGFDSVLPLFVVGVTTGSVYAIAAMGLVLTFRTSGVFNFAHGAQAAISAYLMYTLRNMGLPWPVAALVAITVAGVVGGLVLERLARELSSQPTTSRIVATVGLLVGIQGLLIVIYGAPTIVFDRFLPETPITIAGVNVRTSQLIVVVLAAAAAVGLYLFFRRARLGVAMQAVVDDPELLSLQSISPQVVRRYAWIAGSVFAAVSGILLAHELNLDAAILTLLVVQAFGAAALGAFDSLPGTYVGAVGIGVAAAVLPDYLGSFSGLAGQSILPFLVLFGALLVTPRHRLVDRTSQTVHRTPEVPPVSPVVKRWSFGLGGVALVATPSLVGADLVLYSRGLAAVVLFASLFLLVRTSGQVSLCHMAFAGIGAAVAARLASSGTPWLLAVLAGGLATVPVGAIVAIPAIRLSGVYLAIATFGYGIVIERLAFGWSFLFGGGVSTVSAPRPRLFGLATDSDTGYYYVLLVIACLSLGAVMLIVRSRLGRLLRGLADSPEALSAHGADTRVTRLFAFVIAAFLAGVAGAVTGPITGAASAQSFGFSGSLLVLAVLAIAGRRLLVAPFLAAALFSVVGGLVDDPTLVDLLPVGFGIAAVGASVVGNRMHVDSDVRSRVLGVRSRTRTGAPWAVRRRAAWTGGR